MNKEKAVSTLALMHVALQSKRNSLRRSRLPPEAKEKFKEELETKIGGLDFALNSIGLVELLKDIQKHLESGAALHPGSLIFAEDAPALEVITNALKFLP
jgi:hypothetical protein